MKFIRFENIRFKIEKSDFCEQEIYEHFMEYNDEICYVVDGNILVGIVSIGDFYRYCEKKNDTLVNGKFKYTNDIDFLYAEQIFIKLPNIHEIPVIKNSKFIGIIKSNNKLDEQTWKWNKYFLPRLYLGIDSWKDNHIIDILNKLKCKIYLYKQPDILHISNKINDTDLKLYYSKYERYKDNGNIGNIIVMLYKEKELFFGKIYSEEFMSEFDKDCKKIKVSIDNGICKISDMSSTNFNFKNGYRITPGTRKHNKKIYIFGPCTVTGAYVLDNQTVAFYLQSLLNENNFDSYEIVNCGLFAPDYIYSRVVSEKIGENDIVIISDYFSDKLLQCLPKSYYKGSLSEVYLNLENPMNNIFNSLAHCNYVVNHEIAKKIYSDIEKDLNNDDIIEDKIALQDYYIISDIVQYYREYFRKNNIYADGRIKKVGSIVMNCNPFTNGHKYLISKSASEVDLLYIFVVEEDKSDFSFNDRIEMVRQGTAEFENIKVLPSGKYIISKETFAQYFEKDSVTEVNNMDYDLHIFGEVIAKELNISVRFVGEEPFDKVTKQYNEAMKRLLPLYDIEVIEIPRLCIDTNEIISASKVRKAIKDNDIALLKNMLPDTTLKYLNLY